VSPFWINLLAISMSRVNGSLWDADSLDPANFCDQVWDPAYSFGSTLRRTIYTKPLRIGRSSTYSSMVYFPYRSPKPESGKYYCAVLAKTSLTLLVVVALSFTGLSRIWRLAPIGTPPDSPSTRDEGVRSWKCQRTETASRMPATPDSVCSSVLAGSATETCNHTPGSGPVAKDVSSPSPKGTDCKFGGGARHRVAVPRIVFNAKTLQLLHEKQKADSPVPVQRELNKTTSHNRMPNRVHLVGIKEQLRALLTILALSSLQEKSIKSISLNCPAATVSSHRRPPRMREVTPTATLPILLPLAVPGELSLPRPRLLILSFPPLSRTNHCKVRSL
jgi:hypothetical protein